MARLQGISGGMSGKTGSFTYRQSRGETIVSQYQPVVKNPNTEGQQTQRARFKLMTQLAAIMAPGFGTMGVTKRPAKLKPTQRNAFVSLNMPLVSVDPEDPNVAKIPMEKIQLTSSRNPLGDISDFGAGTAKIERIAEGVSVVRFVEVGYITYQEIDTSTGSFIIKTRPEVRAIVDVPVENSEASHQCQAKGSTVLAFGLMPTASTGGKLDLSNIHTPTDDAFIGAVDLNYMVSNGAMVETMTIGVNITSDPLS